jgi:radical SAM protein with 4Fe4S-binding SPASM domain
MPLRLKSNLHMRKDQDRIVVYERDSMDLGGSRDDFGWRLLHPNFAVLVSLFDGVKSTDRVTEEFGYLIDLGADDCRRLVTDFLEKNAAMMEEVPPGSAAQRRFNPMNLLMDADKLDFSTDRLRLPIGCVWITTLKCGFDCVYCYADVERSRDVRRGLMSVDQIQFVIDQLAELELGRVTITGGDPFSHPHILEILTRLKAAGYCPEVPTKTPLSRSMLQRVRAIGLPSIQFSFDSPVDDETAPDMLRIPNDGYAQRMRRSIETAGELGLKVAINAVLTRKNIDQIPAMVEYYGNLGFVYRVGLSQAGASIYRSFAEEMVDRQRYEAYEDLLDKVKPQYPHMAINLSWLPDPSQQTRKERADWFRNRPRCSAGRWEFTILPNGDMSLCEELYYHPAFIVGNVLETPIRELWSSEKMQSILYPDQTTLQGGPCANCEFFHECNTGKGRCWLRAIKAFRDEPNCHEWPDPYCPKAPRSEHRVS